MPGRSMNPLLIVALVSAILSGAGIWKIQDWRHDAAIQDLRDKQAIKDNDHAELHLVQERDLHALEQKRSRHLADTLNAARVRETTLRADTARLRDAHERMLGASETALIAASTDHKTCLDTATTFRVVFDNCSTRYRQLGAAAAGHVTDIEALIDTPPQE